MKYIGYFLLFLIFFTIFLPRENMFFSLQDILTKDKIYVNTKNIENNIFDLSLNNNKIYYKDINIAKINKIKSLLFIIYNKVELKNIKLNFQNLKINFLNFKYALFSPYKILISGLANFGKIDGFIDIKKEKGKIYLLNLKDNNIKYFLKKDKKGYFYEIAF